MLSVFIYTVVKYGRPSWVPIGRRDSQLVRFSIVWAPWTELVWTNRIEQRPQARKAIPVSFHADNRLDNRIRYVSVPSD